LNLTQLFDLSLRGRQDQEALEWCGDTFTFGDLDARSNRMAQLLASRGLGEGDRLAIYLPNCVEWVDLFLACVKLGVIVVPVNILYRDREIAHILGDSKPAAVVSASPIDCAPPVWDPARLSEEAAAMADDRPVTSLDGSSPAALVYTSGTTGASKGAILSHDNFAANAINLLACWQITAEDRLLLALPLFHVHGLANGVHCWLMSGCRMRLLERFEHQIATSAFLEFRPTIFFGVPTIYVRLLDTPTEAARQIGGFMRLFVSGSAALPAQVLEEFRARFGHIILERYGMSETLMITSNPYVGERRPGTVGLPLPGIAVRLKDNEVQVKGANVFSGYWAREEATRAAFVDGWFRTGDLAELSSDGYYKLCGRKSDLIISGGFNIYPREIEEFLQEQDEIAEAAVVARPDKVRGEVPVAYVVFKSVVDAGVLDQRCREKLASFKVPREFLAVEKLPRNAMGKVQKHLLADAAPSPGR
jgi:malonyl-CoA/methylmalonyl-CoA synthetase